MFCVVKAFQNMAESAIFAQIVVSLVSTYGCYVFASIIACDPWHLATCFAQYLLFAPIYINLLNIFAFSNLHDFSWGTKEQTTAEIDLGVTKKVGKDTVDMTLPSDQTDIDAAYDSSLHSLKTRPMIVPPPLSQKAKEEAMADYYSSVRTFVLLAWVLSNVRGVPLSRSRCSADLDLPSRLSWSRPSSREITPTPSATVEVMVALRSVRPGRPTPHDVADLKPTLQTSSSFSSSSPSVSFASR